MPLPPLPPTTPLSAVLRLTPAELAQLPEYSDRLPERAEVGRRWRRNAGTPARPDWWLGEFVAGQVLVDGTAVPQTKLRWVKLAILPAPGAEARRGPGTEGGAGAMVEPVPAESLAHTSGVHYPATSEV